MLNINKQIKSHVHVHYEVICFGVFEFAGGTHMLLVLKPPQSGVITPVRSVKTNNIIPAFYLHTPSCKYWVMSVIRPNAFGPRAIIRHFFRFHF